MVNVYVKSQSREQARSNERHDRVVSEFKPPSSRHLERQPVCRQPHSSRSHSRMPSGNRRGDCGSRTNKRAPRGRKSAGLACRSTKHCRGSEATGFQAAGLPDQERETPSQRQSVKAPPPWFSTDPNSALTAESNGPCGRVLAGPMIFQKNWWLACPPP